jgi:LPXTG-motif cell wall-anchored protein
MSVKRSALIVMVMVMAMGAGLAAAQTTSHEIKQGTVVHVYGNNLIVKMSDGTVKEFDVPEGFMFNIDGRDMPVSALKPGTKLTSVVTTTQTPHVVKTTEVRNGEVVQRMGRTLIIRNEQGQLKKFADVPEDITFTVRGQKVSLYDLAGGDKLTATIVHTSETIVTEEDIKVTGQAPRQPKPRPAPRPAPAPAPAPVLPSTGSELPLVGLAGLAILLVGLGLAVIRRF